MAHGDLQTHLRTALGYLKRRTLIGALVTHLLLFIFISLVIWTGQADSPWGGNLMPLMWRITDAAWGIGLILHIVNVIQINNLLRRLRHDISQEVKTRQAQPKLKSFKTVRLPDGTEIIVENEADIP